MCGCSSVWYCAASRCSRIGAWIHPARVLCMDLELMRDVRSYEETRLSRRDCCPFPTRWHCREVVRVGLYQDVLRRYFLSAPSAEIGEGGSRTPCLWTGAPPSELPFFFLAFCLDARSRKKMSEKTCSGLEIMTTQFSTTDTHTDMRSSVTPVSSRSENCIRYAPVFHPVLSCGYMTRNGCLRTAESSEGVILHS